MKWPRCSRKAAAIRRVRSVAARADHQDRPATADHPLVPGEVGELVHHRERHGPADLGDRPVDGTRAVEPVGALGATQDRDVSVGDARTRTAERGRRGASAGSSKAASIRSTGYPMNCFVATLGL